MRGSVARGNKMNKKLIGIVCLVLVIASVFAGCSGDDEKEDNPGEDGVNDLEVGDRRTNTRAANYTDESYTYIEIDPNVNHKNRTIVHVVVNISSNDGGIFKGDVEIRDPTTQVYFRSGLTIKVPKYGTGTTDFQKTVDDDFAANMTYNYSISPPLIEVQEMWDGVTWVEV